MSYFDQYYLIPEHMIKVIYGLKHPLKKGILLAHATISFNVVFLYSNQLSKKSTLKSLLNQYVKIVAYILLIYQIA